MIDLQAHGPCGIPSTGRRRDFVGRQKPQDSRETAIEPRRNRAGATFPVRQGIKDHAEEAKTGPPGYHTGNSDQDAALSFLREFIPQRMGRRTRLQEVQIYDDLAHGLEASREPGSPRGGMATGWGYRIFDPMRRGAARIHPSSLAPLLA